MSCNNVSIILNKLGITANLKGFLYLKYSIEIVIGDWDCIYNITKELYPMIATKYNTTVNCVERSIRHSITIAFDRGNKKLIDKIFHNKLTYRPTNGEFISMVANHIIESGSKKP